MTKQLSTAALAAAGALLFAPVANANVLVATIYGVYDASSCGDNPTACLTAPAGQPLATNFATNGGNSYDTPSLWINNNTAFPFTNVQITLNAYQGINNGSATTVPVADINGGTINANTLFELRWSALGAGTGNAQPGGGSNTSANLFTYDYDDYYAGPDSSNPACVVAGDLCSQVGNFDVTMTAMWDGQPIFAEFSPDNTQDNGNAAGAFVGWEGVNPAGWSESVDDNHSGEEAGVLADIFVGTPPGVPEPSTWAMMLVGFAGLGYGAFRRRKSARAIAVA